MKAGSWASIVGVYLFAVCGGATVSKIIPLAGDLGQDFGLQAAEFGWLIAMIALPAAIFAIPSGIVVDRLGPRKVLLAAGMLCILSNVLYWFADSLVLIYAARLLEGLGVVHIYTAGSALIIATTEGVRRTRSMTLWSTYAPVGTAVGLALSGIYAETQGWRMAFVFHGALYALAVGLGLFQPAIRAATSARPAALAQRMLELFSAFGRPQLLLLGVAFLLVIGLGLGTNVTFPVYFPVVHGLSAGEASNMVASATLIMVAGSAFAGFVLPHVRSSSLFVILAALGFVTGALCFYPDMSVGARMVVLAGWYLMAGAALSTVHACLPLVADPARPGAAAALLNFAGALAAFINPPLWLGVFATGQWQPFLILLAVGWAVAVLALLAAIHVAGVRGRGGVTAPGPAG